MTRIAPVRIVSKTKQNNMWNLMLGLFCHEHDGSFMESCFDEVVLERIAISCHFALDLLCGKTELHYSPMLRLAIAAALPLVRGLCRLSGVTVT